VVVTQVGTQLLINGSAGRDVVRIGDDGLGNIAVLTDIIPTPQVFHGITVISIQTFAGNDSVHYDLLGPLNGTRIINANLGTGNKDFQFYTNNNELLPGSNLQVFAHASNGNQLLLAQTTADPDLGTVNLFNQVLGITIFTQFQLGILRFGPHPGTDIALGAILRIDLSGGQGKNVIGVDYQGIVQGTLAVNEQGNGGPKQDQVAGLIDLFGNTTGIVNAQVTVNPGKDKMALQIFEISNSGLGSLFTPTVNATLDGGPQKSVTLHTTNVTLRNSSADIVAPVFSNSFGTLFPFGFSLGSGGSGKSGGGSSGSGSPSSINNSPQGTFKTQ
jgi:hypothetical protein